MQIMKEVVAHSESNQMTEKNDELSFLSKAYRTVNQQTRATLFAYQREGLLFNCDSKKKKQITRTFNIHFLNK